MESREESRTYRLDIRVFVIAVAVVWTAIIAASWAWNVSQARKNTIEEALVQARVAYEKDIIYRRWNTMHGGVYVRVTEGTQPNPYMANTAERDVETTSGLRLTLINPAYMTRQANEITGEEFSFRGHLTSLNPIRPGNAPDEWEARALSSFESGGDEVSEITEFDGEEYMRLMRPLETEEGCLRCHADQGYRIGDIRGGLSVAVSMAPLRKIEKRNIATLGFAHGLLWALGLLGHFFGTRELVRSDRERRQAEEDTKNYAGQLEESNHLKELFIDIMRHDLLGPTSVIKFYAEHLLENEADERRKEMVAKIGRVNNRLTEMIENASTYSRLKETEEIECTIQDLGPIITDAINLVSLQHPEGTLDVKYISNGEYRACVHPMVGDVFVNLASNAYKYAAAGKRLEVEVVDEGDCWRVALKDFGPGISDSDKEKIFTRFERLKKESIKGTGLGLAIARRLVELHYGRIWVEDNPEGGCVFFVALPKTDPSQTT